MGLHHLLAQLLLLVACSSAFPLTLPFSIEPAISKAPPYSPLEKRVDVHTTGDASQKEIEDLKAELDFCIKLARTVVDNVHRNHALYLRFYGSPEYFDEVMAVHRRIADLGNNNQLIRFSFRDEARETGHGQAAAEYGFSENFPTITLYRGYRGQNPNDLSRNVEFVAMQHSAPNLLDRASTTRAGILYHELAHWAGDPTQFGRVIPHLPDQISGTTRNRVIDAYLSSAVDLRSDVDVHLWETQGRLPLDTTQAYRAQVALLLPQFTHGPLMAALNADSYNLFAMAAFYGWNPSTSPPAHPPPQWSQADFRDPFSGIDIPAFLTRAFLVAANLLWVQRGRDKGKL